MDLSKYLHKAKSLPTEEYNDLSLALLLNRLYNGYKKTGKPLSEWKIDKDKELLTLTDEAIIRIGRYLESDKMTDLIDAIRYLFAELNVQVRTFPEYCYPLLGEPTEDNRSFGFQCPKCQKGTLEEVSGTRFQDPEILNRFACPNCAEIFELRKKL